MALSHLLVSRYLDTDGDGTGTKDATGDYSSAAEEFYIQPAAHEQIMIARLLVSVGDTTGMRAQDYGRIQGGITNGVTVHDDDGSGTLVDFTDGLPVKNNAEWGALCYDVDVKNWGAGNELVVARYTFTEFGSLGVFLNGAESEKLVVTVNDDLRGLLSHRFLVQGYFVGKDG